jgi:hypothetical protein
MTPETARVRQAVAAREAAAHRVRLSTGAALAAAALLTGVLAAFAAASTHAKKIVRRVEVRRPATHHPGPVVAPAPPLVQVQGEGTAPPPPASPAPTPAAAPPVVVSGGS